MKIRDDLRGRTPETPEPTRFHDPACPAITGWQLRLPGSFPLATPAVVDGTVFLGGGFGSYDFFALDAVTGRLRWHYQTEDDGPTAAVVAEGCVVFNTESCELEVLTMSGQRIWKKWLGDPLMSMPAVQDGRVFIAFPDSRGNRDHYLAAFNLADGQELWRQRIAGEVITAPVLADGCVHVVCLEGSLACFHQATGRLFWQEQNTATSAPLVWRGHYYFSQRKSVVSAGSTQQTESLATKQAAMGTPTADFSGTVRNADYLDHDKRAYRSARYARETKLDSQVGFGSHKGHSKMEQARMHLGKAHIASIWSYQGSKPFLSGERLYSSMGDTLNCADPISKEVFWKKKIGDLPDADVLDDVLTPPSLVNGNAFLGTADGNLICLSTTSGEILWKMRLGEPVLFQPAVAAGRVYATTNSGSLFCLDTGDPADDGWLMWGATPAHNGI
jgi:outer membrane protein assembly factor BamB